MSRQSKPKSVAFLIPASTHYYRDIWKYIKSELEASIPGIRTYAMSLDSQGASYTYNAIDRVIESDIDLFLVASSPTALIAKKRVEESGKKVPFLFTGSAFPVEYGIIDSYEKPGGVCTGVSHSIQDMKLYCDFFIECFPDINTIALPFESGGSKHTSEVFAGINRDALKLFTDLNVETVNYLKSNNKKVIECSFDNVTSLFQNLQLVLKNVSAIFALEGSRVTGWSQPLYEKAVLYKKILYTGMFEAVRNGHSHLGYSLDLTNIKKHLAHQAKEILLNGKDVSEVPSIRLTQERHPVVNLSSLSDMRDFIDVNHVIDIAEKWNAVFFD